MPRAFNSFFTRFSINLYLAYLRVIAFVKKNSKLLNCVAICREYMKKLEENGEKISVQSCRECVDECIWEKWCVECCLQHCSPEGVVIAEEAYCPGCDCEGICSDAGLLDDEFDEEDEVFDDLSDEEEEWEIEE